MEPQQAPTIDQNADFRMLAVHNHQTQGKIRKMRIFLSGLTGLGIEVAKNLILVGIKQLTIYDEKVTEIEDLGKNFYLKESDVGVHTRLEASIQELKNLNSNVLVEGTKRKGPEFICQNFDCAVILDNYNQEYLIKVNQACRKKNIGFILGGNLGLYGYTFVDFGMQHTIFDQTGEQPKTIHIATISQEEKGIVYLHEKKRHGLSDGNIVVIKEVKGMVQVNEKQFQVQVLSPDSFSIGDTRNFSAYTGGGLAVEIKKPKKIQFNSFENSLDYPYAPGSMQLPICSWQKFGFPEQLHLILNGIYEFYSKYSHLPKPLSIDDAQELKKIIEEKKSTKMENEEKTLKVENIDQNLINNVSLFAQTQISPCCSFWGGIIAQQVIKLSGKYSPLHQWLHHQYFDALPEGNAARSSPKNRYSDYYTIFGDEFMKKVSNSSMFLVGAGALGCEFLKMFSLMGCSRSPNSMVTCTDDDNIEISNLNRQFLFRKEHIGKNKSQVACSICTKINPECHFQSQKLKVSPENEEFFDDKFWTNNDIIINAVDNIKARQYIDNQCVWYERPLFESGTLGTKCHSQIILPFKTMTYNDIRDPPEESFAACTVKSFPYLIEHTIQWAREYFEGIFVESSNDLVKFCQGRQQYLNQIINQNKQNPTIAKNKLQSLQIMYNLYQIHSYQPCLNLAVSFFHDIFYAQIQQLTNLFPQHHILETTGEPYWGGLKRFPKLIQLNVDDSLHLDVIQSAANILATCLGLPMEKDRKKIAEMARKMKPMKFSQKKLQVDDEKKEEKHKFAFQDQDQIQRITKSLLEAKQSSFPMPIVIEFEKDDPTNYHIDFMGGIANLRARNYSIQQVDNFKVKLIAGKIIPAIVTTTAVVVGAVGMEIIKYLLNKGVENFKNVTINLALPLWIYNDTMPPVEIMDKEFDQVMCGPIRAVPGTFTKWEKISIEGPMTIGDAKKFLEEKYKFELTMINYGTATVYSSFYDAKSPEKLAVRIEDKIQQIASISPKKRFIPLEVFGNTLDGVDCILPTVCYKI